MKSFKTLLLEKFESKSAKSYKAGSLKVYASEAEFKKRPSSEKGLNGMSAEFAKKHKLKDGQMDDQDNTNCWNCAESYDLDSCSDCVDVHSSMNCTNCVESDGLDTCKNMKSCRAMRNASNCVGVVGVDADGSDNEFAKGAKNVKQKIDPDFIAGDMSW